MRKLNIENKFQPQIHKPQVKKYIRGQKTEFLVFAIHQDDQMKVQVAGWMCPYTMGGEMRGQFQSENLNRRSHFEKLDIDDRVIF